MGPQLLGTIPVPENLQACSLQAFSCEQQRHVCLGILERAIAAITNTGNPLVVEGSRVNEETGVVSSLRMHSAPVGNGFIGRTVSTQQGGAAVSDVSSLTFGTVSSLASDQAVAVAADVRSRDARNGDGRTITAAASTLPATLSGSPGSDE